MVAVGDFVLLIVFFRLVLTRYWGHHTVIGYGISVAFCFCVVVTYYMNEVHGGNGVPFQEH